MATSALKAIMPRFAVLLGAAGLAAFLSACASMPRDPQLVGLGTSAPKFSTGRLTVVLVDEYGVAIPGMAVDVAWDEPQFYKTSALTDRNGAVSFRGVPEIAEVSINYPGGLYHNRILVPQSGIPELRLVLDTYGEAKAMREREQAALMPRSQPTR